MPVKSTKSAEPIKKTVRKKAATPAKGPKSKVPSVKSKAAKKKPAIPHKPSKQELSKLRAIEQQKEIELSRKRDKILELKASGASIRQIAEHLEAQGDEGVSKSRVHQLLQEALDELHQSGLLKTKQHVSLELYKLDQAELAIFSNLRRIADIDKNMLKGLSDASARGDFSLLTVLDKSGFHSDDVEKYSRSLERIWKRRDSLLGLNKPTKVEHTGQDGKPIETTVVTRVILPAAPESLPGEQEEGDAA